MSFCLFACFVFCNQDDSVSQSSSDAGLGSDHESDTLTIGEAWGRKNVKLSPGADIALSLTLHSCLNLAPP